MIALQLVKNKLLKGGACPILTNNNDGTQAERPQRTGWSFHMFVHLIIYVSSGSHRMFLAPPLPALSDMAIMCKSMGSLPTLASISRDID